MRRVRNSLIGLAMVIAAAAPPAAQAHHSFAMFDRDRPVQLSGAVKEFQWTNPHVWIELMVPQPGGADQEWGIECTSVNFMRRQGWDRTSLNPGDKVKMMIFPLKDGSHGGQFNKLIELNGSPNSLPGYSK